MALNFKQFLSLSQYLQLRDEVLLPAIQTNRIQWVISRALCLFRLLDYRHIPDGSRTRALDFELKNHSPFDLTDYYVVWADGLAQVWFWDKTAIHNVIDEQDINVFEVVPESVMRAAYSDDGLRISETLDDGVDLQFWHQGILLASQWFDSRPSEQQINQFSQGLYSLPATNITGVTTDTINATGISTDAITAQHWQSASQSLGFFKGLQVESSVVIMVISLLAGFIYWQSISIYKVNDQLADIETAIENNLRQAGPNVSAKAGAIINRDKSTRLLRLLDYPYQADMLFIFGQVIAGQGDRLKEWKYSLDKLEIVIESSSTTALTYVQLLQNLKQVKNVTSEPGRISGQIKLKVNLLLSGQIGNE